MIAPPNSMALLLLLNVAFAGLALVAGFLGGLWLALTRWNLGAVGPRQVDELEKKRQREIERATQATNRLRDLASGMANDVSKHSSRVGEITAGLQALNTDDIEATGNGLVMAMANIISANGKLQERLAKAEDQIEAQSRELNKQQSESRTDSLTGLANRRAFDEEMTRRHAEASRKGSALSLLMADIDHFKGLNDTHGHPAGDEVLRIVGRQLKETCRGMDLPCRYGGEEFAIILPATDLQEAQWAAERVRLGIESLTVKIDDKKLKVTVSIGVAELVNKEGISQLVRRCDQALYQSKDAGRNCGHWHDGAECHPTARQSHQRSNLTQRGERSSKGRLMFSLPNRTTFINELRRRVSESTRTEQPISIVLTEVAESPDLRQQHGSDELEAALCRVVGAWKDSLREMDLLADLGENRFGIMLPDSNLDSACTIIERVWGVLKQCPLDVEDSFSDLRVSTGVAELETSDSVESLMGRAETAMACQFEASNSPASTSMAS